MLNDRVDDPGTGGFEPLCRLRVRNFAVRPSSLPHAADTLSLLGDVDPHRGPCSAVVHRARQPLPRAAMKVAAQLHERRTHAS